MENKQTRTFIKGAAILGAAGVICKIIGAIYRIPLTNLIGAEAMGIYSKAYMIYSLLLVLTTSGIPAAVSKLVAEYAAAGDYRNARRTFKLTRNLLFSIGGACALIMLLLSDIIARSLGISEGGMVILCIAPSLLLTAVSAYRGYFQGLQNMTPTALSQIIGQLAKLIAGLSLAALLMPKGPVYAASGALLGVSLSEALSLIYMAVAYRRGARRALPVKSGSLAGKSNKELLRSLLMLAVPLTVGGAIMPLINTLDAYLVTWCLKLCNYSETQINSMYGVLSGMVVPLANMPTALSLALSASLVPAISRARAKKNGREISRTASLGLKTALLIGLPACVGLILLARPVLELLYSTSGADQTAVQITVQTLHSPYHFVFMQMDLAQSLLMIMCPAMLLLTSVQAMTGALQGAGKIYIPIKNLLIGGGVKLIFSAVLISIPAVNILGAPLGTLACYLTAFILDYLQLRRRLRAGVDVNFLLKPLFASAVMALVLYAFKLIMGASLIRPLAAAASVMIGAAVYLGILFITKPFSPRELALIRGPRARGHSSDLIADNRISRGGPDNSPNSGPVAGPEQSPDGSDGINRPRRREQLGAEDIPAAAEKLSPDKQLNQTQQPDAIERPEHTKQLNQPERPEQPEPAKQLNQPERPKQPESGKQLNQPEQPGPEGQPGRMGQPNPAEQRSTAEQPETGQSTEKTAAVPEKHALRSAQAAPFGSSTLKLRLRGLLRRLNRSRRAKESSDAVKQSDAPADFSHSPAKKRHSSFNESLSHKISEVSDAQAEKEEKAAEAAQADEAAKAAQATQAAKADEAAQTAQAAKAGEAAQTAQATKAGEAAQTPQTAKAGEAAQATQTARAAKAAQSPQEARQTEADQINISEEKKDE